MKAAKAFSVEANIDYGLGLAAKPTATKTVPAGRGKCPGALEKGPMPLNTAGNKDPFKGKIVSVERIVGPKATGETTHIVIDHQGKLPYWEGQSYGIIPPVSALRFAHSPKQPRLEAPHTSRAAGASKPPSPVLLQLVPAIRALLLRARRPHMRRWWDSD